VAKRDEGAETESGETIYSVINYQHGILVIYTAKENSLSELEGG
jgi:hypothetical protein